MLIIRGNVPNGFGGRLFALLALGGFQGVIGWWMVKSGLTADATVSQYRLAVHLGMALIILVLLLWTAFDIRYGRAALPRGHAGGTLALVFVNILAGALVAGMDAGLLYKEYPLMGDGLVPVEYGDAGLLDAFENPAAAQFHHRWIAALAVLAVITLALRGRRSPASRTPASMALLFVLCQFVLGIAVPVARCAGVAWRDAPDGCRAAAGQPCLDSPQDAALAAPGGLFESRRPVQITV